jgi:hypothetical protein
MPTGQVGTFPRSCPLRPSSLCTVPPRSRKTLPVVSSTAGDWVKPPPTEEV